MGRLASPRVLAEGDLAQPAARSMANPSVRAGARGTLTVAWLGFRRQQMLQDVFRSTLVGLPPFGFLDSRPGPLVSGPGPCEPKATNRHYERGGRSNPEREFVVECLG